MSDSTPPTKIFLFGVSAKSQTSDQDSSGGQWGPALEAEPATPSPPAPEAAPYAGLSPSPALAQQDCSTSGWQEHGNELLGAACRAGVCCCCSVTDTGTCISKASSGQQPPSHAPWAFHRERHGHTETPNSLTETAAATGSGLQTQCSCERGI